MSPSTPPPEESLKFWAIERERQLQRAQRGLGVVAMVHNFDQADIRLMAAMLGDPEPHLPRRELEVQLGKEAGLSFELTPEQWCVMSIELAEEEKTS